MPAHTSTLLSAADSRFRNRSLILLSWRVARLIACLLPDDLIDYCQCSLGRESPKELIVHQHRGGKATGTEAINGFHREEHVGCRLPAGPETKPPLDSFAKVRGTLDVTGGAVAHADEVLSLRFQGEERIECGDPENPRRRDAEGGCDKGKDFLRQIAILRLYGLEYRDKMGRISPFRSTMSQTLSNFRNVSIALPLDLGLRLNCLRELFREHCQRRCEVLVLYDDVRRRGELHRGKVPNGAHPGLYHDIGQELADCAGTVRIPILSPSA